MRQLWRHATTSSQRLARLGLKTTPDSKPVFVGPEVDGDSAWPGVAEQDIPDHIMSLLCYVLEARLWTYKWSSAAYPQKFASVLASDGTAPGALAQARQFWETMTAIESFGDEFPGLHELRQQVYWLSWPVTQLLFRLLAHTGFAHDREVMAYIHQFFARIGDTKVIEESNKLLGRAWRAF